jgi:integrase
MEKPTFDPFSNKPDISASSRKLYTFNLTKLNGGKEIKNLNFLSKPEILEKLEEMTPNTRRTYIIAIVSSLKDRPEAKYKKLYSKFYEHLTKINADLKTNNTKSEKQEANWLPQEEVMKTSSELAEVIPQIRSKKSISSAEYDTLLKAVVLGLYALQKPRRNKDYTDCLIVKKVPEDTSHNYLDIENWEWVFNNYKTEKTYKQKKIAVPEELKEILQVYLKFHPCSKQIKKKTFEPVPFLAHQDGKPINTSTEMTRMLNKIFGKKVGSSLLRNIFLTDKYGKVAKEMANDVSEMGTSIQVANDNYIKQD